MVEQKPRGRCTGKRTSSSFQRRGRRGHGRPTPEVRTLSGAQESCHRSTRMARSLDRCREALSGRGSRHSAKLIPSIRLRGLSSVQSNRICIPRICINQGYRKPKQRRRHCVAHVLGRVRSIRSCRVLQRSTPVLVPFLLRGQVRLPVVLHESGAMERSPNTISPRRSTTLSKASRSRGQRLEPTQQPSSGRSSRSNQGRTTSSSSRPSPRHPSTPGSGSGTGTVTGTVTGTGGGGTTGGSSGSGTVCAGGGSSGGGGSGTGTCGGGGSSGTTSGTTSVSSGGVSISIGAGSSSVGGGSPHHSGSQPYVTGWCQSKSESTPEMQMKRSTSPETSEKDYMEDPQPTDVSDDTPVESQTRSPSPGKSSGSPLHTLSGNSQSHSPAIPSPTSRASGSASGSQLPSKTRGQSSRRHSNHNRSQQRTRLSNTSPRSSQAATQRNSIPTQTVPMVQSPSGTTVPIQQGYQPTSKAPNEPGDSIPRPCKPRHKYRDKQPNGNSCGTVPQLPAPCYSESSREYLSESTTEITCNWPHYRHGLHCACHCWFLKHLA